MTKKEIKEVLQAQGFSREEARAYLKIARKEAELFEGALELKRLRRDIYKRHNSRSL